MSEEKKYERKLVMHVIIPANRIYCRSVNANIAPDESLCKNCPLGGTLLHCSYFDIDDGQFPSKERTDALVAKGAVDEFPDFVDGWTWGLEFRPYESAMKVVAKAYRGVMDGDMPAIAGIIKASMKVKVETSDVDATVAAALAKLVKDGKVTVDQVEKDFGKAVADILKKA